MLCVFTAPPTTPDVDQIFQPLPLATLFQEARGTGRGRGWGRGENKTWNSALDYTPASLIIDLLWNRLTFLLHSCRPQHPQTCNDFPSFNFFFLFIWKKEVQCAETKAMLVVLVCTVWDKRYCSLSSHQTKCYFTTYLSNRDFIDLQNYLCCIYDVHCNRRDLGFLW